MKTYRFYQAIAWTVAILMAGFAVPDLSAGVGFRIGPIGVTVDSSSKKLAAALAPQIQEVKTRFDARRLALKTVIGQGGKSAFLREDVTNLIMQTGAELGKAIESVQPKDLAALHAWADHEVQSLQAELAAVPRPTAALSPNPFAPRAVAVLASLGGPKATSPKTTSPKAAAPKPAPPLDTVPAEKSNSILDKLGAAVSQIFTLAENDQLQVKVWIGSTEPRTDFHFWPQNQAQGDDKAAHTVQTDGKLNVFRGLYAYQAGWTRGAVTNSIRYPPPADAPTGQMSEPLDLVKGSRFFCCRFDRTYCHHVDSEKECRP